MFIPLPLLLPVILHSTAAATTATAAIVTAATAANTNTAKDSR